MDLLAAVAVSLLFVPLAFIGGGPVQVALGLVFALFVPGYSLVAALFPKRDDLDVAQRLALSFGLSIVVVTLNGLVLNYTPWGVNLYSVTLSLFALVVAVAAVAWYRRRRLPGELRFEPRPRTWLSRLGGIRGGGERVLLGLLVVAIIGVIGTLVFVVNVPQTGDRFTEFYMLGPEGRADDYPQTVVLGEKVRLIIGVVNHEGDALGYSVVIVVAGKKVTESPPIVLANGERWEHGVSFAPAEAGEDQLVEVLLYRVGSPDVYRFLRLWIDVVKPPS